MSQHNILLFIMTVLKPFKLVHYKLSDKSNHAIQDKVTSTFSFVAAALVIVRCFPYNGIGDFITVIFGSILAAVACAFLVSFLYPHILKTLSVLFLIPAMIYDACDDEINNVSRTTTGFSFLNKIPRAEVGIKYFIEREKRIQVNHAKYVGPN